VLGHTDQCLLVTGDGVPHNEPAAGGLDQHATVATVVRPLDSAGVQVGNCGGGDEWRLQAWVAVADQVVEVAEEGRRSVERAVAAEEARVRQDAAPGLADERGAEEVRGLVRRDAEEDLLDELLHQRRQRARAARRRRRRHGCGVSRIRRSRWDRGDAHDTTPGWSWSSIGLSWTAIGRKATLLLSCLRNLEMENANNCLDDSFRIRQVEIWEFLKNFTIEHLQQINQKYWPNLLI